MSDRQLKIYRAFTALAGLALVEDGERFEKYGFQICHAAMGCDNSTCPVVKEGLERTNELIKEWHENKVIWEDTYLEWL